MVKAPPGTSAAGIAPSQQYGKWANQYDTDTASYGWSAPERLVAALDRYAPPHPDQRVLDVGVGTGLASQPYAAARAKVTGLDIAPEMLEELRQKGLPYARLERHDINLPFSQAGVKPAQFDVVMSCGTLHFAKDLRFTLGQMAAAAAPGAIVAFTYVAPQGRKFGPSTHLHEPREVQRMLAAHGLEPLSQQSFVAYHDKGDPNDPVRYELVVARKSTTNP